MGGCELVMLHSQKQMMRTLPAAFYVNLSVTHPRRSLEEKDYEKLSQGHEETTSFAKTAFQPELTPPHLCIQGGKSFKC